MMRVLVLLTVVPAVVAGFPWQNQSLPVASRIEALLHALTLEEKIGLMGTDSYAVPRLNVTAFNWQAEGLHGIAWENRSTVFPAPIGLAATFNRDVLSDLGKVDAREARAKFYHGDGNGLNLFAPNLNIFRDPRWGRGQETLGEDPVLIGELGAALISAAQEPFADANAVPVLMTDKHYAVYNLESNFAAPLNGSDGQYRLRFFANATDEDLNLTYLVPHAFAVSAGVSSVMCAYNAVNGLPNCANGPLLSRLRSDLGFDGPVVTDCGAITFSVSPMNWTTSHVIATAAALNSGTSLNCGSEFQAHLHEAFDKEIVTLAMINQRLEPVLAARVRVGNFDLDDPYHAWYKARTYSGIVDCPDHRQAALRAARQSLVLLRNSPLGGSPILPLSPHARLAVVGPNANRTEALLSNYAGCRSGAGGPIDPKCSLVNVLEGIMAGSKGSVTFAEGVEIDSNDTRGIPYAMKISEQADAVVVVLGLSTCQETGPMCQEAEAHDRKIIGLPGKQEQLLDSILTANPRTILVLLNGGAISGDFYSRVPVALEAFYPGALGGTAVAEALFGQVSPAGRLPYSITQSLKFLPDYYSMGMTDTPGRTYRYSSMEPGFAFAFGLTYTSFMYENVRVQSAPCIHCGAILEVVGSVFNQGQTDGGPLYDGNSDEVVLCFAPGPPGSFGTPQLGLVGFTRLLDIAPKSSRQFAIVVSEKALLSVGWSAKRLPPVLYVGSRAPGTAGIWADSDNLPPEPVRVEVKNVPTQIFV